MKRLASTLALSAVVSFPAVAADITYRKDIAPIIKANCLACHDDKSPTLVHFKTDEDGYKKEKIGPRLDSYMDLSALIVWPDTGAFMRRLDDGSHAPDGKPGNMYRYLGDSETERQANLAVIKAWVGEKGWNLNRWKQRGDVPAITKEQLDQLKLKY